MHTQERSKMPTEFGWENLTEKDHFRNSGYRWKDNKMDLKRNRTGGCGCIWLRIGTSGKLLHT